MPTDDETLERVRRRAGVIRHRRRLAGGGALASMIVLLFVVVAIAPSEGHRVTTQAGDPAPPASGPTTATDGPIVSRPPTSPPGPTTEVPSSSTVPSTDPPASAGPRSSSAPPSTAAPDPTGGAAPSAPSTAPPPSVPAVSDPPPSGDPDQTLSGSSTVNGLTLDVAITYSTAPDTRTASVAVRVRTARGGHVGGTFGWDFPEMFGSGGFGDQSQHADGCQPVQKPDPDGAPVDLRFDVPELVLPPDPGVHDLTVVGWSSACWAERAVAEVRIIVDLR